MKLALFCGLFFVSSSLSMRLIDTSLEVNNKIEELPKIILVTERGGPCLQDCVICLKERIGNQDQAKCHICEWESKRVAKAAMGLIKHIIKNHSNINVANYWDENVCKLCNVPIKKSSASNHLINLHIHEISEHRYCQKSMAGEKGTNANDSMNVKKGCIYFNLSEFKSGIQNIHANSLFCLLCVKEHLEKKFIVPVGAEPAVILLQRSNVIENILKFLKLHELKGIMNFLVTSNNCAICKQDFSHTSRAYHHTLFKHIFTSISHIYPQGNCLNKFAFTQSNERQKKLCLFDKEMEDFLSSDFLTTLI